MYENEIAKYRVLNQLAESDGTVIFGGSEDVKIPLGELKQAFALGGSIYNRSFPGLHAADAARVLRDCVCELCPDTVLLHIGEADLPDFQKNRTAFEADYRGIIAALRETNKDCRIVIVSLKNYDNNGTASKMNEQLKSIADSEKCEFEDISQKRAWNVKASSETASFIYEIGFDRPLNIKRPLCNLVRILFCYEG